MRSLFRFLLAALPVALCAAGPSGVHFSHLLAPVPPDLIVSGDSASFVIPFTRAGNLILIRAKVDTTTGYFILDTGAPGLELNNTYFHGDANSRDIDAGGITGSTGTASRTTVDSLRFGPAHFSRVEADLLDLSGIENRKGVKILGLLGIALFERFELIFDCNARLIYLHEVPRKHPAAFRNPFLADTSAYETIPIRIQNSKIIVYGYINARRLKFLVDSGAETNVLDSRLPGHVLQAVTATRRVTLSGVGGGKIDSVYGNLHGLRIGDRDIGSLPVVITNLESMLTAYEDSTLDGMLGFDFLALHKIGFDFVRRKMYIWK